MAGSLMGIYDQVTYSLRTQTRALTNLQEQASTGNRVNRASDDPLAASDILAFKSQIRSYANYDKMLGNVLDSLKACSLKIDTATTTISKAKEQLTGTISGLLDSGQRAGAGAWINEMLDELVTDVNTQYGDSDSYIFAGSSSDSPAYTVERSGGKIVSVTYSGSDQTRDVEVAPGVQASAVMVGKNTFGASETPKPLFGEDGTGVSAGTGTSTAKGIVWLTVQQDGDDYRLSIDGGSTWTVADGSANQAITDSSTGAILYVNTSSISKAGTDLVQISGTGDVFNTLIAIRDALESGDTDKLMQLQTQAETIFDDAEQSLIRSTTWVGAKQNGLESLKDSLEQMSDDADSRVSQLQDADTAQVAIDLSRYELLYQMTMSAASRVLSKSLLDFMD